MVDISCDGCGLFRPCLFVSMCGVPCNNGNVHELFCVVGCGGDGKGNGSSLGLGEVSVFSVSIETDVGIVVDGVLSHGIGGLVFVGADVGVSVDGVVVDVCCESDVCACVDCGGVPGEGEV